MKLHLFIVINSAFVGAVCNSRGTLDSVTESCICRSPYHGIDCELKRCPSGVSWFPLIFTNMTPSTERVGCSNMGICDTNTGVCNCRNGYDGKACEKMKCPTELFNYASNELKLLSSQSNTCSNHGRCYYTTELLSLYDPSLYKAVNPPFLETNLLSKLQQCICDPGWQGYDCSQRSCPLGVDPLSSINNNNNNNILTNLNSHVYTIQCQADNGYFALNILNQYTYPIPYNAHMNYLKYALESISLLGEVYILSSTNTQVCHPIYPMITSFILLKYIHEPVRMTLTTKLAATRQYRDSNIPLELQSDPSQVILKMMTNYTLTCPICTNCQGYLYLVYKDKVSEAINITATNSLTQFTDTLQSLLQYYPFMNTSSSTTTTTTTISPGLSTTTSTMTIHPVTINITSLSPSTTTFCNANDHTIFNIILTSTMGNIGPITIIDSSQFYDSSSNTMITNLTWSSSNIDMSDIEVTECSHQGICDRSIGVCNCLKAKDSTIYTYSSDGFGNRGLKADCGYLVPTFNCSLLYNKTATSADICSGRGICTAATGVCTCQQGWSGWDCSIGSCPKGPSWYPQYSLYEPREDTVCSSVGFCDHTRGECVCRPGFYGISCQYYDCERTTDGIPCENKGLCVNRMEYLYISSNYSVSTLTTTLQMDDPIYYNWFSCVYDTVLDAKYINTQITPGARCSSTSNTS